MAPPRIWRWLRSYWPKSQGRIAPLNRRTLPRLEQLEDRLTPATLLDAGGSLAIFLGSNEHLSIVANASSYTFTSNEGFTDGGVGNPGDFSPFGSSSLTLLASGISRYSSIAIMDESEGSGNNSVTFDDSGVNSYANDFSIDLSNAGGPITFNGQSQFGAANLQAATTGDIVFSGSSSVASSSGNVALVTGVGGTIVSGTGVSDIVTGNGAVTLSAGVGGIGTAGNPLGVSATSLTSSTAGNADQFFSTVDSVTIGAAGLNAGSGTVALKGGTFILIGTFGTGPVVNEGVLVFNRGDFQALPNAISGAGSVEVGPGTLALSGANSYSGGTTVTGGGQILVEESDALGTGSVTVESGLGNQVILAGAGIDVVNDLTIEGGAVVGQGSLQAKITSGSATWSGPITITGGTQAGGHFGTGIGGTLVLPGTITANVPVVFRNGTFVVSGSGSSFTQALLGEGTIRLGADDALPTNVELRLSTSNDVGTLDLAGFDQTLAAVLEIARPAVVTNSSTSPATLTLGNGDVSSTYAGTLVDGAGPLALVKMGTGTLMLVEDNTYSGGTTISGGTLQVGVGGAGGTLGTGGVTNDGVLAFNRSDFLSFANDISGTGSLVNSGIGTLALTGANTYSGGTAIHAGTLSISSDANLGAVPETLTTNLTFDGGALQITSNDVSLDANRAISLIGPGSLISSTPGRTLTVNGPINGAQALTLSGAGSVRFTSVVGDDVAPDSLTQSPGAGRVQFDSDVLIGEGGATLNGDVALSGAEVAITSDGPLTFGSSSTNTVTINGAAAISAAALTLNAVTTVGGGFSLSVDAATILVNASISATAGGAITLTAGRNIAVTGTTTAISVVDGDLTLEANADGSTTGNFSALVIDCSLVSSSGAGAIQLLGHGGDAGDSNRGILIQNGGRVSSTAVGASAGTISITGTAAGDFDNFGVLILGGGSTVASVSGDIAIVGTSAALLTQNHGVYVVADAAVVSTGTGPAAADIAITGMTTAGVTNNVGVNIYGVDTVTTGVRAVDGDITILGSGSGTGVINDGIRIQDRGFVRTSGAGVIDLIGSATLQGGTGVGISIVDDGGGFGGIVAAEGNGSVTMTGTGSFEAGISLTLSTIGIATSAAPYTLNADVIAIDADSTIQTSVGGTIFLKPKTPGRAIDLGGTDNDNQLGLSDAELDRIVTGTLEIGDDDSGTIAVSADISRPSVTTVRLTSGSSINFSGGSFNTSGGGLTLAPGSSAQVSPSTAGTDVSAATLNFSAGTTLRVALGGTSVDSQYEQLRASGTVDLSGVDLLLAGNFVPAGGNVFTIVSATNIVGTFADLAEGDTVRFNGMALQVKYTATSVTLVARDFTLTGAAPEDRLRPFAIINQGFTTRLATIDVVPSATAVEFAATIDWGDGTITSGAVQPTQTPTRFAVVGSHTYTTENTFAVSVTVTLLGSIVKQVFAGSAVVLTADQSEELERFDFEFLPPGGGSLSADTEDVQATLLQPQGSNSSVTLSVAEFEDSPVPDEFVARDFPTDQVQVAGFFDVRVTGAVRGTRATVVFEYDARGDPIPALLFFDPDINDFVPVQGSTALINSMTVDPVRETISVDFDSLSTPPITEFSGTVFAISVPLPPTGPPRDAPPAAPTPTPFGTTTASLTPSVAIATAQGAPRNAAVHDGVASPRVTVSFRSSTQRSLLVNSSQDSARTLAVRSAGAVEEGKGEAKEEKQPDNKEKPPEDPKQPPEKKESNTVSQEKVPEPETGNKPPPPPPQPKAGNNKELPDKEGDPELPPELLDAHFSSGAEEGSGSWAAPFGLAVLALPRSPRQRGRRVELTR